MQRRKSFGAVDFSAASDMRRSRSSDLIRTVAQQADHLPPKDRALITQIFVDGIPINRLAQNSGEEPRRLARRVKSITKRMLDPRFKYVTENKAAWRPTRQRVAAACIVEGLSMREASEKLKLSPYTIRKHREAIDAMFESAEFAS
ncbi:MAG: hypothetical protein Phyf2KO_25750 [Phycisphaerales bacterium]